MNHDPAKETFFFFVEKVGVAYVFKRIQERGVQQGQGIGKLRPCGRQSRHRFTGRIVRNSVVLGENGF